MSKCFDCLKINFNSSKVRISEYGDINLNTVIYLSTHSTVTSVTLCSCEKKKEEEEQEEEEEEQEEEEILNTDNNCCLFGCCWFFFFWGGLFLFVVVVVLVCCCCHVFFPKATKSLLEFTF